MHLKLNDYVYFGDWASPFENIGVKTVINVASNLRSRYYKSLSSLPSTTLYFRLAKGDREDVDRKYLRCLEAIVSHAADMNMLPLLTHCKFGGHRGPTSAIAAAYFLSNGSLFELKNIHDQMLELRPGLINGRNYYRSTMKLLYEMAEENEK